MEKKGILGLLAKPNTTTSGTSLLTGQDKRCTYIYEITVGCTFSKRSSDNAGCFLCMFGQSTLSCDRPQPSETYELSTQISAALYYFDIGLLHMLVPTPVLLFSTCSTLYIPSALPVNGHSFFPLRHLPLTAPTKLRAPCQHHPEAVEVQQWYFFLFS